MDVSTYKLKKAQLLEQEPKYRTLCAICAQPQFGCYCSHVRAFDPQINFVILIHPVEVKRRIATGRMSHLCLQGSYLIPGQNYTHNRLVNELLNDPLYHSVILYPGSKSLDISRLSEHERAQQFTSKKKLRVFVIDGTWATARKMIRQSINLQTLPSICFVPPKPSNFRVRKQPKPNCYSTIEAIHHTIELLGASQNYDVGRRTHDRLMDVFDHLVDRHLEFIQDSIKKNRTSTYRRVGQAKNLPSIDINLS